MKKLLASFLALTFLFGLVGTALAADPLGKYDPPITVKYARSASLDPKFKDDQSYENNIWITEYRDVLGINVDTVWTAEGVEAYNQKLQLSILSQDIPDIFVCNPSQFQMLVEADMLEDLTDVLPEYQSELVAENLTADKHMGLNQATVGGKLYGLPYNSVGNGKMMYTFIREDWRVALGLEEPKTLEDLVEMAKAFTQNDPDGNGVADTYGFGISNEPFETYFSVPGFFNSFGAFPNQWILKDGKVEFGSIQPEMKTALAALKDWYDQGLIDPEFIVKNSYTVSQDAIAGKVGIAVAEWWMITWPLPDGFKLGQDWKAYPILFAESAPEHKIGAVAKLENRYVVRKGYEHPEALVKMYNLFQERVMSQNYDTTLYKTDGTYDFQGLAVVYTVIGHDRNMRNHIVVTEALEKRDPSLLDEGNADQVDLYRDAGNFIDGVDLGVDQNAHNWSRARAFVGPDSVYGRLKYYDDNDMFKVDPFYGSDTPAMTDYAAQLKSDTIEMILDVVTGEKTLDAFDAFVEHWKSLGGDDMTAQVNAWYEAQQ